MIYQRFITNRIYNFIDLCSLSNISVFILDEPHHGYYIHGRSPHGKSDVNVKDILINFNREKRQITGTRGLPNGSNDQLFILKMNDTFQKQYESLFRSYYVRIVYQSIEIFFCLSIT
jgi:meckelin